MKRRLASVLTGAIFALALTPVLAAPVAAASPFSFAVIGDMPYGAAQLSVFPQRIGQINADPDVQMVGHLGDIGGPPNCSDSYYSTIKSNFDLFSDPLLYTPGDNEWSDCSDASVGAANPLNRLAAIRQVFFPQPGRSLGQNPVDVTAQPGYPENVLLQQQDITVGMVHIVGPSNGLGWWSGNTAVTPEQKAEVVARTAADISLIRSVFATAKTNNSRAVVLMTQADMFTGTPNITAYGQLVKVIAAEALAYGKPVYLFNGDTHTFASDKPLAASKWLAYYGITAAVPNLSRFTVRGGPNGAEWLKVKVVSSAEVLSVQRVTFGSVVAPVAAFTATTKGLSGTFNAAGSSGAGGVAGYKWTFGDGTAGSGIAPSHEYAAAGTYSVTLLVTDSQGGTASKTASVTVTSVPGVESVVVPAKSSWSWRFAQSAPDLAWKNPGYDVSTWGSGPGVLGFGSTGLGTNIDVSGATSSRPLAAYFVKKFTVESVSAVTKLSFSVLADDGVVVFVNGSEVGRSNMPAGPVTINTYATSSTKNPVALANPAVFEVPVSLLVNGTNTIAAESHLNYHGTKDISFDLTATATTSGGGGGQVPNLSPVAAFTNSTDALVADFDGSASKDPDGTIVSYAWTFGDGGTGSGPTVSHAYAKAGSYNVALTVTDDQGAKGTITHQVTVAAITPPDGKILATDSFSRSVASGFGSAEIGGAWSVTGATNSYSVNGGAAAITGLAKKNNYAYLNAVSSSDTDVQATVGVNRPTVSSVYAGLIGRRVGTSSYGARVVASSTGYVQLHLQLNTDTLLKTVTVPGLSLVSGDKLQLRLQVTGSSPTTISAKVWKTGTVEPATWQLNSTDSTAALQAPGAIGIYTYLSTSGAPNPATVTFDNLQASKTH
ncbi:PKD domain-containing protein [Arthrobacter sp. E3]|uniref:PKD domain-containing protein n=1 Tax=Arthrobacter sp. E3 TaxID=517402 RepID=UPI001A94802E